MTYHKLPKEIIYDVFKKYNLECIIHRDYVDVCINSQQGRAMAIEWKSLNGTIRNDSLETSLHFNYFYKIFHNIDELERGVVFLMQMEVKL